MEIEQLQSGKKYELPVGHHMNIRQSSDYKHRYVMIFDGTRCIVHERLRQIDAPAFFYRMFYELAVRIPFPKGTVIEYYDEKLGPELGVSSSTIRQAIKGLKDVDLVRKVKVHCVKLDPRLVWTGGFGERQAAIAAWDTGA